jgi:epoxyqueuosine reductase
MSLETEIRNELANWGAAFVHFVDVSHLPEQQNKGLNTAILFGLPLTPEFIREVAQTDDYVEQLVKNNRQDEDEFSRKEAETDRIADDLADYLQTNGYSVYSQSEKNLIASDCYDADSHSTLLPHKTIAVLAGIGWIGKHNLLVSNELGSALSICTVLTDAPLPTPTGTEVHPKCGNCTICRDVCPTGALTGKNWDKNTTRDELVNVYKCTTCLKCLVHCPWTQSYTQKHFAR